MELLRLSQAARILPSGPDRIYWLTESDEGVWSLRLVGKIASLLVTPASVGDVLCHFAPGAERDHAARILQRMTANQLVEHLADDPSVTRLRCDFSIDPHQVKCNRWLEGAVVIAPDEPTSQGIAAALAGHGVRVASAGGLRVAVVDEYLDGQAERLHREFRHRRVPWMPVKYYGDEIWVGPIFQPDRSPCWRCLAVRLREKYWLRTQLSSAGLTRCAVSRSEGRLRVAAEFAAQHAVKWLLEVAGSLEGSVWQFRWSTMAAELHTVTAFPNCPDCGHPPAPPASVELAPRSTSVVWRPPGDLRTLEAQSLVARLAPLASPITGILRQIECVDGAPSDPVHLFGAVHNVPIPDEDLRIEGAILQPNNCSGRGCSVEEAKAACLAEAVERYSLGFRGDERWVMASYNGLGDVAIHPSRIQLFSEQQFLGREEWNREHSLDEAVPERFDGAEEIAWVQGWSLSARAPRFLPVALCSQYYRPAGSRWIGDADSNGCAAGSCREEAILHGIFELVERDARAVWWYNRIARPAFSPRALTDEYSRRVCEQLESRGWSIRLHDITTDLAIPVFLAIAINPAGQWVRGSSACVDAGTALRQAIFELWQLTQGRLRPGPAPPYVAPDERQLSIGSQAERTVDLRDLIEDCCRKIEIAGCEVTVFDLTRPELPLHVTRVVAAGLRPNKPRFAPGRLYDVPVRLGWLSQARAEHELPRTGA